MNNDQQHPPALDNSTTETPALPPAMPQQPAPTSSGKKRKLGVAAIVIIVALFLVAGSATAYFGLIVPNRPENILKKAFANTTKQQAGSFTGKVSFENLDPSADIKAVNVNFDGQSDTENEAFQTNMEVSASGIKLPFEIRGIDNSLFVKVGDFSNIKNLVEVTSPEYAPLVDFLNKELADKWMEIDETMLKQAGAGCVVDMSSLRMTDDDLKLISQRYDEVPFIIIKNQSDDTVNGLAATKFEIEIDNKKTDEFGKGLEELSFVKKLKECNQGDETVQADDQPEDDVTPMTIWVDKGSKTITKLASETTRQSEERDNVRGVFEMTMQYGPVEIAKPSGAWPITEVLASLYNSLSQDGDPNNPILQNLGL